MMDSFDPKRAAEILRDTVTEVMADMAFLDAEPRGFVVGSCPAEGPEPTLGSRVAIDVLRPISCRIELRSQPEFLSKVMEILFVEPEQKGMEREDAVLEMLNVVAGSFLTTYFGHGVEIKLELPRYVFYSDGAEGEEIACLDFDVEGFPLRIVLSSIRYRY
jgi:hypothetical protein